MGRVGARMDLDRPDWPLDKSGMLPAIEEKGSLIRAGYEAGRAAIDEPIEASGLLFAGMGFSGVSANLVKDACTRSIDLPFSVVKHYQIPRHVKPDWHCLSVSYSGATEETLSVTREARERGVPITAFTTGGPIGDLADTVVDQPAGYQPRAAFAYTWASILGFLESARILDDRVPVDDMVRAVDEMDRSCGPTVEAERNEAKALAVKLHERIPQIYATPAFYGVGLHFRGMLNENAKKIADVDLVPECNHNDLTGWSEDPNRRHFTALAISHAEQNPEIMKRLAFMQTRYTAWGVPWHHHVFNPIHTFEEHVIEQARALQFLDYTSFYTAMLRGQDPSEIREISGLKAHLRKD